MGFGWVHFGEGRRGEGGSLQDADDGGFLRAVAVAVAFTLCCGRGVGRHGYVLRAMGSGS